MNKKSALKPVSLKSDDGKSKLSRHQKSFNSLIQLIEKRHKTLLSWEQAIPPFQQRYVNDLLPLTQKASELRMKMAYCLHHAHGKKGLSRTDRQMISEFIAHLASSVASINEDIELKAIYNKHSGSDYDKEGDAAFLGMKSMLEDVLGVDLGDDLDLGGPESFIDRATAHMDQQTARYEAERQAREERAAKRKKTPKQLAKEAAELAVAAQQQAEQEQVSQSIREVFRKLASALHPDRERDPVERERKNGLMQRANLAYQKRNLLELLKLQLELEHIDQNTVNSLSESRLKHYNIILREQLSELEHELWHVKGKFCEQFELPPFSDPKPSTLMRDLDREISGAKAAILQMEQDLLGLVDSQAVKRWLKKMHHEYQWMMDAKAEIDSNWDDCPF